MATRITVGMPVYNGTEHVAGALKSLQEQTFQDFEVIISVDGNDQATADVCRPFCRTSAFGWSFIASAWTGLEISIGCCNSR